MMRRKNLERAVILGLLLSTSVYSSAFAAEPINETITDGSHNGTYNEDVIIDAGNNSAIEIDEDTISISTTTENLVENETGKIELNSNKYGIRLDGSSSVSLTAVGDNVIKVTANSTDDEIGDGINVTENAGGTITLNGANNTITVEGEHSDGIYTATGSSININLIATTGSNTITATNNGIDHRGNGTITLKAENGSNVIKTTNGDGIRVEGTGTVEFNAKNNEITAGDNGIQVAGGGTVNVTANAGANYVYGGQNAVYNNGSGTITISAIANKEGGISTLANIEDFDNVLSAGKNGVQSDGTGETNVIADNNNIIAGTQTGILSDGAGTINITAGNNNYIGQYTDDEGTHTSNIGIKVTEGTVNIAAENENRIYGLSNGIIVTSEDTNKTVNVIGDVNSITIENATNNAAGINFNNVSNGSVNVNNGLDSDGKVVYADRFNINVSSSQDAMGFKFDSASGNEVNVYANDISIKTDSGERGTAIWIQSTTEDNTINLNANDNVYLSSSAKDNASGAVVWFTGKENTIKINGGSNTITSVDSLKGIEGIHLAGSGNDISITANSGDNQIYSQSVAVTLSDSSGTFKLYTAGSNTITSTNNSGLSISNISEVNMTAKGNNTIDATNGIYFTGSKDIASSGAVKLTAANNIIIADSNGIYLNEGKTGTVTLTATSGNNEIIADKNHGISVNASNVTLTANNGKNVIKSLNPFNKWDSAIYAVNKGSTVSLTATQNEIYAGKYGINSGANKDGGIVNLTATTGDNLIETDNLGVRSVNSGEVTVSANNSNLITGSMGAIAAYNTGNVRVTATNGDNKFIATGVGEGWALDAESGSTITANAVGKGNKHCW